jgi:hypothetical protein
MAGEKPTDEKTGKNVRDLKGNDDKPKVPTQVQVHAGNISVLTIQFLSEISQKLGRIATALEKKNE